MNLDELKADLSAQHSAMPQRRMLAELAVEDIRRGIAMLENLGHRFELEVGALAPTLLWPKMLYHPSLGQRVVDNRKDFEDALASSWQEHPTDPKVKLGPRPNGEAQAPEPEAPLPSPVEHPDMALGGVTSPAGPSDPSRTFAPEPEEAPEAPPKRSR